MRHAIKLVIFLICVSTIHAFGQRKLNEKQVRLMFTPQSDRFATAAREYEEIWAAEGQRMIAALEDKSGLQFEEFEIPVVVLEEPSFSGYGSVPMRMRASYPADLKKEALIHELGHRLQDRFFAMDEEDHPYLFLYLYDVWVQLYGNEFANHAVAVESARKGYDYEGAWKTALAMTPEERQRKWQDFLASKSRSK